MNANSLFKLGEKATCANLDKWLKELSDKTHSITQRLDSLEQCNTVDRNEETKNGGLSHHNSLVFSEQRNNLMFRATIISILDSEKCYKMINSSNIIILNLKPSDNDYIAIKSLLNYMYIKDNFSFKRLGRSDLDSNRIAPIKCMFDDSKVVSMILRRKKILNKVSEYQKVFIKPDVSLAKRIAKGMLKAAENVNQTLSKGVKELAPASKPSTDYTGDSISAAVSENLNVSKSSSTTTDTKPKDVKRQSITSNRSMAFTSGPQAVAVNSKATKSSTTTTDEPNDDKRQTLSSKQSFFQTSIVTNEPAAVKVTPYPKNPNKINGSIQTFSSQPIDLTQDENLLSDVERPICKFGRHSIFKKDLNSLEPKGELNDTIINCYLDLICRSTSYKCAY
ncbi:unnamed protein product, partial [Brachionus calyciflorus]